MRIRAALFDIDDTLAESFQPPSASMLEKLTRLLEKIPVAIISASGYPRLQRDFLPTLEKSPSVKNLYLLPNSSAQAYTWQDGWNEEYSLLLSPEEKQRIHDAIEKSVENPDPRALILDREVQIAYAAIGLESSLEEKKSWDPDQSKRNILKKKLDVLLPEFEVLIGGMTTIDITKGQINKAYGVRWLSQKLRIPPEDMLFVGDALYEGGNDAVVIPTGIQTNAVKNPAETEQIIDALLASE